MRNDNVKIKIIFLGIIFLVFFGLAKSSLAAPEIFFGVYTGIDSFNTTGGITEPPDIPLNTFETDAGKNVSLYGIVAWWRATVPAAPRYHFSGYYQTFADNARSQGAIPVIMWQPYDPGLNGGGDYETYAFNNITAGNFDAYLRTWADEIRDWGHPIILRPFHELNTSAQAPNPGIPWAAVLYAADGHQINQPSDFAPAWQHIVNLFRSEGAVNVKWMWSVLSYPSANYCSNPSDNSVCSPVSMASVYPGDDYVDYIGIECYGSPGGQCSDDIIRRSYDEASALSAQKPMMMAEMGNTEDSNNSQSKADWYRNALDPGRQNSIPNIYPRIMAVMFWNSSGGGYFAESSVNAIQGLRDGISSSIYDTNNFGHIDASNSPLLPGVQNASFVSQDPPSNISAGQIQSVSVTMKNTGTTAWQYSDQYNLGSQNPADNHHWGPSRIELGQSEVILPGQQKNFTFDVTAPLMAGSYNFQWKLLQEGVTWFGDLSSNVLVSVGADTTPPAAPSGLSVS